jgi:hypothetical protein
LFRTVWRLSDPGACALAGRLLLACLGTLDEVPRLDELLARADAPSLGPEQVRRVEECLANAPLEVIEPEIYSFLTETDAGQAATLPEAAPVAAVSSGTVPGSHVAAQSLRSARKSAQPSPFVPLMTFEAFWTSRRWQGLDTYQESCAGDTERGRFAVAGGSVLGVLTAYWSQLLTAGFVHTSASPLAAWSTWLPPLQRAWAAHAAGQEKNGLSVAEINRGAFASFLGVVVDRPGGLGQKRWEAAGLGDNCLFLVRGSALHTAFPRATSGEFSDLPGVVGSRTDLFDILEKKVLRATGDWQPNDDLWLMTSNLARWFLQQVESWNKPWNDLERALRDPRPEEAFAELMERLRKFQRLGEGDVTVLLVRL